MSVAEVTPVEADEMDKKKKEKPPPEPAVSLAELFQYATPIELVMLAFGCLMLTGIGVCYPLMLLPFREIFGLLGASGIIPGAKIPMEAMLRVLLTLVFIGCGIFVFHMIGTVCLELVAASQMLKYKRSYLKAVLRQDVGWYDISNPEELSTQFAEAMVKIQKGLKSIAVLFMGLGYGFGGGILAFLPSVGNWEISLVTLGTVPILVIAASIMMYVVGNGAKLVAAAYGQAGGVATEVRDLTCRSPPLPLSAYLSNTCWDPPPYPNTQTRAHPHPTACALPSAPVSSASFRCARSLRSASRRSSKSATLMRWQRCAARRSSTRRSLCARAALLSRRISS